ncbi:MAG: ABC transporter ATP-binding protein [Elusimicrobia bacterium]|nr:ABC transporter ATP-binding protein [Elusimicrobiota bacterium]
MRSAVLVERLSKLFNHVLPRRNTVLGRLRGLNGGVETWALRDVSFEVEPGECFGITGPNGAGKSTLLSLIAGILMPTGGRVEVGGRTNAFLGLAHGLQPELSVLDNVEICGILMGMRRREALRRRDAILDFAGLSDRAELRLAELSTGQAARVAFSTALHADLDIMLVDETLSVGDAAFQAKCERAIDGLRRQGKTLLVASHDLELLRRICRRSLRLDQGRGELSIAPKPRVLFIGNSLTYDESRIDGRRLVLNDVPGLVSALRPEGVETETVAEGGQNLQGHWEQGRARRLIESGKWDFVVLQEESTLPLSDAEQMRRYARLFNEEIRRAGSRAVLFMTWAKRHEPQEQDRIARAYQELGAELGAAVAPVGSAWAHAIEKKPDLELHSRDQSHAAPLGAYLASRVLFSVLFAGAVPDRAAGLAAAAMLAGEPRSAGGLSPEAARFLDSVAERFAGLAGSA